MPGDILRALDLLAKHNPALIDEVYKTLQKRMAAVTDPQVLILQEQRRMAKDKQNFITKLAAYALIFLLGLIISWFVGRPLAEKGHAIEAAGLFGTSFAGIVIAILNPFGRKNNTNQQ